MSSFFYVVVSLFKSIALASKREPNPPPAVIAVAKDPVLIISLICLFKAAAASYWAFLSESVTVYDAALGVVAGG